MLDKLGKRTGGKSSLLMVRSATTEVPMTIVALAQVLGGIGCHMADTAPFRVISFERRLEASLAVCPFRTLVRVVFVILEAFVIVLLMVYWITRSSSATILP